MLSLHLHILFFDSCCNTIKRNVTAGTWKLFFCGGKCSQSNFPLYLIKSFWTNVSQSATSSHAQENTQGLRAMLIFQHISTKMNTYMNMHSCDKDFRIHQYYHCKLLGVYMTWEDQVKFSHKDWLTVINIVHVKQYNSKQFDAMVTTHLNQLSNVLHASW